jgi:hypothetical protein
MIIPECTTNLKQFRRQLYQNFTNRADTLMELVDALCSNPQATSPVELTLTPCFRRSHSALYKALAEMKWDAMQLPRLLAPYLPPPKQRSFRLLGVDVTPQPRPYASTLSDRGMVYQPTVVKGNKPVTVGHQYSSVALLPEAEAGLTSSWVLPLLTRRVRSEEDKELVGAEQIDALLRDEDLPFADDLCVEVGDTGYSKPAYLHANRHHDNLVTIARARGNRTFYQRYVPTAEELASSDPGHPRWYGDVFRLPESETWHTPDEQETVFETSRRGKQYRVEIQAWHNMLMPGKHKPTRIPMHEHPFTLVRVVRYDAETGKQACRRPLWLIAVGGQRHQLTARDIYDAYGQRFDLEHFFRYGKQKLLLTACQTPDDAREERWWQLVHIAYAQLWMARHVARFLPRPWEQYSPAMKSRQMSPTLVQRDFGRIIRQIGTPAKPPKPRGYSPGRRKGKRMPPRPRQKVVVKGQKQADSS